MVRDMTTGKEYETMDQYYWEHPKEYPRLKAKDMRGNEGVVSLCEEILSGLRKDCESIVKELTMFPANMDARYEAISLNRMLRSDVISSMSFGGSLSYADEFRNRCPGGVFAK